MVATVGVGDGVAMEGGDVAGRDDGAGGGGAELHCTRTVVATANIAIRRSTKYRPATGTAAAHRLVRRLNLGRGGFHLRHSVRRRRIRWLGDDASRFRRRGAGRTGF